LLFIELNWRSNLSKPALCCNRQADEEWAEKDSVLAGADVCSSFSSRLSPCLLLQRGFLPNGFDLSGGSLVAEFVWCFLVWERGRGPGQESTDFSFDQIARRRIPAQTWASRIGLSPEGLGAGPVRFFFVGQALPPAN